MADAEKLKRKEKPRRGVWRRQRMMIYITIIGMLSLVLLILILPMCGCSIHSGISDFEILSTEIRATNNAVEILIQQTNTAIAQSTPHP